MSALYNYKVHERHFHSGKPASLYSTADPKVVTLASQEHGSMGVTGSLDPSVVDAQVDRCKRVQERED